MRSKLTFLLGTAASWPASSPTTSANSPPTPIQRHDQVRTNWAAIFEEVPDVQGELSRAVACDGEEWGEWRIFGTRRDGSAMQMRGVIINGIREDRIAWARLYLQLVEEGGAGIDAAVSRITGPA